MPASWKTPEPGFVPAGPLLRLHGPPLTTPSWLEAVRSAPGGWGP
jgi:hypothetical protein